MNAQTFHFRRHPAEQALRLAGGSRWGRRSLAELAVGLILILAAAAFWTFPPREVAIGLLVGGLGLLAFAAISFCIWLCRALTNASGRPWGRVLVMAIMAVAVVNLVSIEQHRLEWLPVLNGLQWTLAVALLLRLGWLVRRPAPGDNAAIWAAGATGEDIVSGALAGLDADHVVIHNLPLPGRGDADHVIVGPAGVIVVETKYLAGRIICRDDGIWLQLKRDEVRQIPDPSAQAQRAADAIATRLGRFGFEHVPVRPVLVMAHPRAELDVARHPLPVVRPFELVAVLRRLAGDEAQLDPDEVAAAADTLLGARSARNSSARMKRVQAQALVELACGLSVTLVLAFGLLGVARVTTALLGLTAVTREAARAGSRAPDAATAFDWAVARGDQVAAEYGLGGVLVDVDTSSFDIQSGPGVLVPGEIRVRADVTIDLTDVPVVGWTQVQVPLERRFAEVVDPYRSAQPGQGGGG